MRLAAEHSLDLAAITGTGRDGRVVKADVSKAIAEPLSLTVGNGYTLVSVFGAFNARALLETSAKQAAELLGQPLAGTLGPTRVVDATLQEIAEIEERSPGVGSSPFAAAALALAYELDNPFNSATAKGTCSRSLAELFDRLGARSPEPPEVSPLDAIRAKRERAAGRK